MGTIGVTDSITGGYNILKNNIGATWPMIIFTLVVTGLTTIFSVFLTLGFVGHLSGMQNSIATPIPSPLLAVGFVITIIAALLIQPLVVGTYLSGANRLSSGSKKIDLGRAFAVAKSRYLSLLGSYILNELILLAGMAIPLVLLFSGVFSLTSGAGLSSLGLVFVGFVLMIVAFVILVPLLFLSQAAVIIEGKRAVSAVKRSIEIGRNAFWKILGIMILIALIAIAIAIVISILDTFASFGGAGSALSLTVRTILDAGLSVFIGLLSTFTQVVAFKAYLKK